MSEQNALVIAHKQLDKVCKFLKLDPSIVSIIKEPQRVLEVSIPVTMDNGEVKVFKGYRSQHNDAVGPTKGGLRFHQDVTIEEVKALSIWMTFKCGVLGLPYGGGKGGITVDPTKLSSGELERLSRAFMRAIADFIGEKKDIPAPDVNTNPTIMGWMLDEYFKVKAPEYGVLTGKPLILGGSQGRTEATGRGVSMAAREALKAMGLDIKGAKVVVQGYGNVGSFAAKLIEEMGAKIVAISDISGGYYNENGIDLKAADESYAKQQNVSAIATMSGVKKVSNSELLELPCDVLVPAALENQITEKNANNIKCKLIVEGANGPTSPEADEILKSKGIVLIPDILANAGGVTVSYFEWVQNLHGYYWSEKEVNAKLEEKMVASFQQVWAMYKKHEKEVDVRTAAYMVSIDRVAKAIVAKGQVKVKK